MTIYGVSKDEKGKNKLSNELNNLKIYLSNLDKSENSLDGISRMKFFKLI